jgi:hypothetical protein
LKTIRRVPSPVQDPADLVQDDSHDDKKKNEPRAPGQNGSIRKPIAHTLILHDSTSRALTPRVDAMTMFR